MLQPSILPATDPTSTGLPEPADQPDAEPPEVRPPATGLSLNPEFLSSGLPLGAIGPHDTFTVWVLLKISQMFPSDLYRVTCILTLYVPGEEKVWQKVWFPILVPIGGGTPELVNHSTVSQPVSPIGVKQTLHEELANVVAKPLSTFSLKA